MALADEGLLEEVPFFKLLDKDERATLAAVLDEETLQKGKVLFRVGDPVRWNYG
jgi:hypothetical protein